MTARYAADEVALREALVAWFTEARVKQPETWADALLASGVVQSREDAVREARREYAAELAALYDNVRNAHHSDATAATPTRPGTDRPAAEDGPPNTGTGSAS